MAISRPHISSAYPGWVAAVEARLYGPLGSRRIRAVGSANRGPITTRRHILVAELSRRSLLARLAVRMN